MHSLIYHSLRSKRRENLIKSIIVSRETLSDYFLDYFSTTEKALAINPCIVSRETQPAGVTL